MEEDDGDPAHFTNSPFDNPRPPTPYQRGKSVLVTEDDFPEVKLDFQIAEPADPDLLSPAGRVMLVPSIEAGGVDLAGDDKAAAAAAIASYAFLSSSSNR
uniref:Uncharacterized protein n=1 Tax=Oryza punctata TaxID=4537 RepID=A0A0E0M8M6_ORYPU